MKLVVDGRKKGGKRKSRLQKRFDGLRTTLEKERGRNMRFRQDLDELVETFHRRSVEHDESVFEDLVALSEKLIVLAGRKTLSGWHRGELDEWLKELIGRRISQVNAEVAARLRLDYRHAIARSMGMSLDELDQQIESASAEFDAAFRERNSTEHADDMADDMDEDPWQESLFEFDDDDSEPESFDAGYEADEPDWLDDEDEPHLGRSVMDGSWAKGLFRRAAQALHPDRERDPELREAKQVRMRELLKAREDGDIMTILTMYSQTVSDTDITLPEQEMTEVCDALEFQLDALEMEKQEYIYSHPVRNEVFELFYHSTKKGRARRLQQWENDLEHEVDILRSNVAYLRNLANLKRVLKARRQQRNQALFDVFFDDIRF